MVDSEDGTAVDKLSDKALSPLESEAASAFLTDLSQNQVSNKIGQNRFSMPLRLCNKPLHWLHKNNLLLKPYCIPLVVIMANFEDGKCTKLPLV